ncbi:MAG: efflux RND transporter periplasmic adaptor subunit [Pseudomonadota bacterium]
MIRTLIRMPLRPVLIAACLVLAPLFPASASPLVFEGRVEPLRQAVLATRINGVVAEVLFDGGDYVQAGQPLIRLDPADAELALSMAEARLAEARAAQDGAAQEARRQEELFARGIAPDAVVAPARTALAAAKASLALAQAERDRAALDLQRAMIRAPVEGFISAPAVTVGQFLEAEAGPPLATIVALDTVTVAYQAPYADRLGALEESGAATVNELLERITLSLSLPGDRDYPATATPHAASPTVDPQTGTVTVWAVFPNPDGLLRPGMRVTVLSSIGELSQ